MLLRSHSSCTRWQACWASARRFKQAEKLLDSINQGVAAKMKALPQAFHEPVLPEDSLSDAQVDHCRS